MTAAAVASAGPRNRAPRYVFTSTVRLKPDTTGI
jgi:hypothetical protein